MRAECKKMFWHQKGLFLVLCYVVLSFAALVVFDTPRNSEIQQNRQAYQYYLKQVEGKCTAETEHFLAKEAEQIAKANNELQRLYDDYYDGKLTEKEFSSKVVADEKAVRYQKGFELLYQQYNGIREKTENRWFLSTNGWDGLLAHDSLNLPFVLLLLLLVTPVFCQEYENKMDDLIKTEPWGARHYAKCKIALVLLVVCGLCLLNSGLQYLFYEWKYGLPHGDYPLQSLPYFATFTRKATLAGTFFKISVGRLAGNIGFAMLILFVSACTKKYALALFTSTAVVLLPYYGFTQPSAKYLFPGPLGLMVSTGFFRGNEYQYDALTQEKVLSFQEIGSGVRQILLGVHLCLLILMAAVILKKHTNVWCKKTFCRIKRVTCLLVLCGIAWAGTGCSVAKAAPEPVLFNLEQRTTYENDQYRFFVESPNTDEAIWVMENKATGQQQQVVRDPMQSDTKVAQTMTGYGPFIYYMQVETIQTGFLSSTQHFSIIEVDTRDFSQRIVLEHSLDTNSDTFLGIGQPSKQEAETFKSVEAFFIGDQYIYLIGDETVTRVNRVTGKTKTIIEVRVLKSLSYNGSNIYYINEKSQLMQYNIYTGKAAKCYGIVTQSFLLTDKEIVFINRLKQNQLYAASLADGRLRRLTEEPVLSFTIDGNTIDYTAKTDLQEYRTPLTDK